MRTMLDDELRRAAASTRRYVDAVVDVDDALVDVLVRADLQPVVRSRPRQRRRAFTVAALVVAVATATWIGATLVRGDATSVVSTTPPPPVAATAPTTADSSPVTSSASPTWLRDVNTLNCSVIGKSPSNFEPRVELDCGSQQGLRVGMPVVSNTGLVGKITTVALDTSVVMMLTDPLYTVLAAAVDNDGATIATGRIEGMGDGAPLQMTMVEPLGEGLKAGDHVVTAGGTESNAPAGIPIGLVQAVAPPDMVEVTTPAEAKPAESLTVVLYTPSSELPLPTA